MNSLPSIVDRLYVVVRGDMPVGLMAAQAIHAARMWPSQPIEPTVVVFRCPPEKFEHILEHASMFPTTVWREPDQNNAPTAFSTSDPTPIRKLKLKLL